MSAIDDLIKSKKTIGEMTPLEFAVYMLHITNTGGSREAASELSALRSRVAALEAERGAYKLALAEAKSALELYAARPYDRQQPVKIYKHNKAVSALATIAALAASAADAEGER